jgi:hypothetical protein
MYGLEENGNGVEAITAGMKDPGNIPEKVIPGNQVTGRMVIKDINGIRDPGNSGLNIQ